MEREEELWIAWMGIECVVFVGKIRVVLSVVSKSHQEGLEVIW